MNVSVKRTRVGASTKWRFQHKEALVAVALILISFGFFSLDWSYSLNGRGLNLYDGVSTVGAERVLDGEIPYRDFWTMYAPGQFYLVALLFRVFGLNLFVETIAASVVCAATAYFCYRLGMGLVAHRFLALACAVIFVVAMYNTRYFWRLGSYPTAILLILVALNLLVSYYQASKIGYLVAAGLLTGAAVLFKHDIAGYTALAIVAGLVAYQALRTDSKGNRVRALLIDVGVYAAGLAVIAVPPLIYFAVVAGPDMLQNLIIFPLTDFRFARPEGYPSLLPTGIYDESPVMLMKNLTTYLNFAVPFGLFVLGLAAIGLAVHNRRPKYAALTVTFVAAFLLHYTAAHVQINTHIVTMSVYALCMGAIFYHLTESNRRFQRRTLVQLLALSLVIGWSLSLVAQPAYLAGYRGRRQATVELELPKVAGYRLLPEDARILEELTSLVDAQVPQDQPLFVGLHRHDIVVIGDILIYYILDRPNATRYQELHPAITDTAPVQREIIGELRSKDVSLVILKHIFSDETLDAVKVRHSENLPQIGATELDDYIRQNYTMAQQLGPYEVWQRKAD